VKIKRKKSTSKRELDKRFYAPFVVQDKCEECGTVAKVDLEDQYLSYPIIGEPNELYFYCRKCEHDWRRRVVLDVTITEYTEESED